VTGDLRVARGNEDQAAAWNGEEGERWVALSELIESGAQRLRAQLFETAGISAPDRVLDIGCGSGRTSLLAARAAREGSVLGVDLSGPMLALARKRAEREGVTNVTFAQGDAQVHDFEPSSFDIAISQFGSMFFADQVAGFSNIARALRPQGRLVLVSWRRPMENELMREISRTLAQKPLEGGPPPEAISPFRHADPDHTRPVLEQAGFVEVAFTAMDEPMILGEDVDAAFDYATQMFGWQSNDLDQAGRVKAYADLRASLDEHRTADGLAYGTATWLITATRA